MNKLTNTNNYQTLLKEEIKEQIQTSQIKAIASVNSTMIILYYNIGKSIHEKQKKEGWGAKVIQKLSLDLKNELTEVLPKEEFISSLPTIEMIESEFALTKKQKKAT